MSGLNLGRLLQEAGVKGAKPSSSAPTLEEVRGLSRKTTSPEQFLKEAADRLPPIFQKLKNSETIKEGKGFMRELRDIFICAEDGELDGVVLSEHILIGICQLAHWHRDRKDLSPSRKKSFKRIIPWLLECRDKVQKKTPSVIGDYMNQKLDEYHNPFLH